MMQDFKGTTDFVWSVADEILRDDFRRSRYPDVILPFTVLRRVDCVLADTKEAVLARKKYLEDREVDYSRQLARISGHFYFNTSRFDFERLLADPANIATNFRNYLSGFTPQVQDVFDRFRIRTTVDLLEEKDLLFQVVRKFASVDLHPHSVSNHAMGTIFEELLRKFNEQTNENPGEHFTPREVIQLMVRLLLSGERERLGQEGTWRSIYDPACGSGGMLSILEDYIRNEFDVYEGSVRLYGQEINDETFAICVSDMLLKGDDDGARSIRPGSVLSSDGHPDEKFDYMLSNPPYGKDWKKEQDFIREEADRGRAGRFYAGLPRTSDGQLLFLQHMVSKMRSRDEGGSRIAIIMNGSPLFTGGAGSGESEIRRWLLEGDLVEAIVALPTQLFYNTGISTYIWIVSNRKSPEREGKVLLVNGAATEKVSGKDVEVFARRMKRSLGDKRNELSPEHIQSIVDLAANYEDTEHSRIFSTTDFGYRRVTVERPLRLNFVATPERISRLYDQKSFINLARSRKSGEAREIEIDAGRTQQSEIQKVLEDMEERIYTDRTEFLSDLDRNLREGGLKIGATLRRAMISALSERDATASICLDASGIPEPDPALRDTENVPLSEDVDEYFRREVHPHDHEAWIDRSTTDDRDGGVGKVGYEINFNRYFHRFDPPRSLREIDDEIRSVEAEILDMLREVT